VTPAVDIDKVKELIQLMVDNDLLSISLRSGSEEITLRRPGKNDIPAPNPITVSSAPNPAPAEAGGNASAAPSQESLEEQDDSVMITSPMVGTFYSSAHPGAPPFVQIGSAVTNDSVVCIIEAMKVFNEIPAEVAGVVEKVLVANEQAVEFGQPLFAVRPS
jgi:acetyl-CoA carboxylase biotin carboxyl carrier protein